MPVTRVRRRVGYRDGNTGRLLQVVGWSGPGAGRPRAGAASEVPLPSSLLTTTCGSAGNSGVGMRGSFPDHPQPTPRTRLQRPRAVPRTTVGDQRTSRAALAGRGDAFAAVVARRRGSGCTRQHRGDSRPQLGAKGMNDHVVTRSGEHVVERGPHEPRGIAHAAIHRHHDVTGHHASVLTRRIAGPTRVLGDQTRDAIRGAEPGVVLVRTVRPRSRRSIHEAVHRHTTSGADQSADRDENRPRPPAAQRSRQRLMSS